MNYLKNYFVLQLKNMIAALYSSRQQGTKDFTQENIKFGWKTVEKVFTQELERAENGLSRKVPGLKYAFVYRDNWTRLNVRPAKIMQVSLGYTFNKGPYALV